MSYSFESILKLHCYLIRIQDMHKIIYTVMGSQIFHLNKNLVKEILNYFQNIYNYQDIIYNFNFKKSNISHSNKIHMFFNYSENQLSNSKFLSKFEFLAFIYLILYKLVFFNWKVIKTEKIQYYLHMWWVNL